MKAIRFFLFSALFSLCSSLLSAQTAEDTVYVFQADMPDGSLFLPPPPSIGSVAFTDDMVQFQWGKTQRNTPRGLRASRESNWTSDVMRTLMAEALSLDTISDVSTPALSRLLVKSYNTGDRCVAVTKVHYGRTRPFVQMNDPLWALYDDDYLRTNGSYPSGHTSFAWFTALAFSEMWPALQDTILRRGFLFGENRIITGAHYQSDVTAGFLCSAAAFARAHVSPELQKDIKAARAEYALLKGLPADFDPTSDADVPHGEDILNPPVDTTSYRYISDLSLYWATKPLRDTYRGHQAAIEAAYSSEMMYAIFSEATGITIGKEATPAICALIDLVLDKSSKTTDRLKPVCFRKRPFVQLSEPSSVPAHEEKERDKSSFPSGHANLGWAVALTMAEVAPDCQNEILRRGFEYGYNRVIVGYHWFTDIESTRLLSSALFARLHADTTFQQLMCSARKEYQTVSRRP